MTPVYATIKLAAPVDSAVTVSTLSDSGVYADSDEVVIPAGASEVTVRVYATRSMTLQLGSLNAYRFGIWGVNRTILYGP